MQKRGKLKISMWQIVSGVGILIFILLLGLNAKNNNFYEHNYWQIVTNPNKIANATIREVYGEPNEVTEENGKVYAKYHGFSFLLSTDDPLISNDKIYQSIQSVIVTDPKFRFGSKKIGVGSTRKEVEKAYKNITKNIDVDCGYRDGDMGVDFFFDDDDKVKEILIGFWP